METLKEAPKDLEVIERVEDIEKVPVRASFDSVTREAIGGRGGSDLPRHYFRSARFIGTFVVSKYSPMIIGEV